MTKKLQLNTICLLTLVTPTPLPVSDQVPLRGGVQFRGLCGPAVPQDEVVSQVLVVEEHNLQEQGLQRRLGHRELLIELGEGHIWREGERLTERPSLLCFYKRFTCINPIPGGLWMKDYRTWPLKVGGYEGVYQPLAIRAFRFRTSLALGPGKSRNGVIVVG